MTFQEYEESVLEFAMKANVILWEGPPTDNCNRVIEKLGLERAKVHTLGLLFRATKLALPYKS